MENKNLSKLQIRSIILSIIESLKFQSNLNYPDINDIISQIKSFNKDNVVCEILMKELLTTNSQSNIAIITTLLLNAIDSEMLENKLFEVLRNKNVSDSKKSMILEILAGLGKALSYDDYQTFFDDPSRVINEDTIKLLNSAMVHPESKVDFLDFFCSLGQDEKLLLLDSLMEDHNSDLIVNLIQNIIYIEKDEDILCYILDIFNKYKSPLAYEPIVFLLQYSKSQKVISIAKRILKEYNFARIDSSKVRNINKIIVEDTVLEPLWMTYPDGEGNVGVIVSRIIKSSGKIQMMAFVANDNCGITGCFGFSQIVKEDFLKIVTKFSKKDEQIKLDCAYLKPIINYYKNINFQKDNVIPYEFLCFSPLTYNDNEKYDENCSIISIIDKEFGDDAKSLDDNDLNSIFALPFIKKWFFTTRQVENLKDVVDKIYETQNIDVAFDYFESVFYFDFKELIKNRLKISALLYKEENFEIALALYSLCIENNGFLFDNFIKVLYKKSIYQHFLQVENDLVDSKKTLNIFFLKNKQNEKLKKIDIKIVDKILNEIETTWKMT